MPEFTGTALEKDLLGVLQRTVNGDTSILAPNSRAFYNPAASDDEVFSYAAFVTKKGVLSEASPASGATLTLSSSHEVAQFRAGDVCFLVGGAFAGAVNASDNTADQVTVVSTSPSNQTVIVSGRAGGAYSIGAGLVQVSASAPGGTVGSASAGRPAYNQWLASLLEGFQAHCSGLGTLAGGAHTTTRVDVANAGGWDEEAAVLGATITFVTATSAALVGCTAKVASVTVANPAVLNLEDIKNAAGESVAVLPATPADDDTVTIALDLSEGKLGYLSQAGGDMTTMVSSLLTMHRRLDEAFVAPEIPLVAEWDVMGQATGSLFRMTMPAGRTTGNAYTDASDTSITVEWDEATADLPIPLSGQLRVINAQDSVGGLSWAAVPTQLPAPSGGARTYVAYTRRRGSNVLNLGAAGVLGSNIAGPGRIVEIDGLTNGYAKSSGYAPQVNTNYIGGLLFQLAEAVRVFVKLGA